MAPLTPGKGPFWAFAPLRVGRRVIGWVDPDAHLQDAIAL